MFRLSLFRAVTSAQWTPKYEWQSISFVNQGNDPKIQRRGMRKVRTVTTEHECQLRLFSGDKASEL
jgi:hypothetical protein